MPSQTIRWTLTSCLLVSLLAGCKDRALPSTSSELFDRAKALVTGDRLPETTVELALKNHGFPTLLKWAEEGDRKAQHFVAVTYLAGMGAPKNFALAEAWARRAANQGSSASQFLMGAIRRDAALGTSVLALEPNLILSYMWFSLAAAQGHQAARTELEKVEKSMQSDWVDRAQALALAWRACTEVACVDREADPGPASHCKGQSKSVLCP